MVGMILLHILNSLRLSRPLKAPLSMALMVLSQIFISVHNVRCANALAGIRSRILSRIFTIKASPGMSGILDTEDAEKILS